MNCPDCNRTVKSKKKVVIDKLYRRLLELEQQENNYKLILKKINKVKETYYENI